MGDSDTPHVILPVLLREVSHASNKSVSVCCGSLFSYDVVHTGRLCVACELVCRKSLSRVRYLQSLMLAVRVYILVCVSRTRKTFLSEVLVVK